ncbi:MAG: hypothetical protein KJO55_10465, partial [Gammaproteobacteria bacterium]|nr:hypothetical protein [Gammaproteobacteria bacterium]
PPELTDDTEADLTLYGGAKLKLETDVTYGGFLPVAGTNVIVTAKGDVNLHVLPIADPWWEISGTPNLYVDVVPQLLFANLAEYSFVIIEPEPEIFFTSQNEFPFSTQPVRSAGGNVAGDALRWSRAYYEPEIRTNDVAPTSDGGAIAVGDDLQFGVILKTDFQGNREWQRRLEGDYKPLTIRQLADGGYVLGGKVGTKLWLARFDATGGLVWSKEYAFDEGQPQDLFLYPVAGGVLVGGEFLTAAPELDFAPYAMQIGLDGTPGWAWLYGQAELDEEVLGFTGTADGGLMLVGETDFTPVGPVIAGQNAYTLRLLPDGTVYWSQVWASANVDRLYAAAQAPDGSYLVGGVSNGTTLDQSTRGLLIRYPADDKQPPENARWLTAIGGNVDISQSWWDEIRSIVPTRGGFTIAGHTLLGEERKAWLAKVTEQNDDPDLIWSAFHDGGAQDNVVSLHDIGDGYLLGGDSTSFGPGNPGDGDAMWISRLPYEAYMHWNSGSFASANYTNMVEIKPPQYPSFAPDLNITAEQDITSLEQQVPLTVTLSDSTQLLVFPDGFPQAELVRENVPPPDSDGDGVVDDVDNCTIAANADQTDTDGDGYGNACDPDFNNDGSVNFIDLQIMKQAFFSADPDVDLTGDGIVNFADLQILKLLFFGSPGPSGIAP